MNAVSSAAPVRPQAARNATLLKPFGPPAFQPLGQLGPVLLSSSDLCRGLLPPVSKSCELLSGGHQLGLELDQISNGRLLLVPLGQELVLTGFQLGQLLPEPPFG